MVATVIRWVAIVASALVIVGFGAFAIDASREGSNQQVERLSKRIRGCPRVERGHVGSMRDHSPYVHIIGRSSMY